jgi:hypothetical protein
MSTEQDQTSKTAPPCPHFEEVEGKTLRQLFSKVAAVRSENRELFDFTHRPIKVHQKSQANNTGERVVSEEHVYQQFDLDRGPNFTVVIEGEVGTGKSELCAYLAHRLSDEGRPLLHVDKNDDLMSLLSEGLPEFYEEHFDEELPEASNFQQLRDDLKTNERSVAANASSGAILNLRQRGFDVQAAGNEENIQEFVQDRLSLLVEKGEYAREIKFISEQAYNQNDFLQIFSDNLGVEKAVKEFNQEVWRQIRDRYHTASLDDVLEQIGEKFTDTRPAIIFEDFGITAMEAEKLRDYMELDSSSGWDFVVAGTRDSTQVLHTRTAEDRFEFYRTNKRDSNSVLFLDEDSAVDFIRPYLGYFKSFDDSVRYDRGGEGLELTLKSAPSGSICHQCGFCDESFRDLFPFNESFLRRIYTGLDDSEQSPREYVMAVFDILRSYYQGYAIAPSNADRLDSIRSRVSPSTKVYEDAEPLAKLARWYGCPEDEGISIPKQFVEAFGLESDVSELEYIPEPSDSVIIPTGDEDGPGPGPLPPDPPNPPTKTKAEKKIEELTPNVQPWQNNLTEFPDITRYLKSALTESLQVLTNGYELYDTVSLRYNLSSQKSPFVFKGEDRAPANDQIYVDEEEFRLSGLQRLLKYGIRKEEESRSNAEPPFEALGTQLTGYAKQWRQKIQNKEITSEYHLYKREGYTIDQFALATYAHIFLFDSPTTELTAEAINKRFIESESYSLNQTLKTSLQDELDTDEYQNLQRFINYADYFEELIEGFYGVTSKQLDVARIRNELESNPPYQVLDALGRQNISRISLKVRFDTNNKLRRMADTAYDLKRVVESVVDEGDKGEVIQTFTADIGSLSLDEITELANTLQTYDTVDPELLESLNTFIRTSQSEIDKGIAAAELAEELSGDTIDRRLQSILISRYLTGSTVYKRYNNITIGGGASNGPFAEQFKTISSHYVE